MINSFYYCAGADFFQLSLDSILSNQFFTLGYLSISKPIIVLKAKSEASEKSATLREPAKYSLFDKCSSKIFACAFNLASELSTIA